MLKGLLKRKEKPYRQDNHHTISDGTVQGRVVDFKQMGIDHIFVDESQCFKNLMFNTSHDEWQVWAIQKEANAH